MHDLFLCKALLLILPLQKPPNHEPKELRPGFPQAFYLPIYPKTAQEFVQEILKMLKIFIDAIVVNGFLYPQLASLQVA